MEESVPFWCFLMQKQAEVFPLWPSAVSSHCTALQNSLCSLQKCTFVMIVVLVKAVVTVGPSPVRSLQWSPSELLFSSLSTDRAGGSQHKPSTVACGRWSICLLGLPLRNIFDTVGAKILHFCEVPHSAPLEHFRKKEFEDCCFESID